MNLRKNAAIVTLMGAFSLASGVILDGIIVAIFGLGTNTDSYYIAATIPLALTTVIHLQTGKVIQPLFIHSRVTGGAQAGWQFLRQVITVGTLVVFIVGAACALCSSQIVQLQSPGQNQSTRALATKLSVLFFLVPAISCPGIIMGCALSGLGNFFTPGCGKLMENVSKIVLTLLFFKTAGILVLPLGSAGGALIQALISYVALRTKGFRFRLIFRTEDGKLISTLRRSTYPLAGHISSFATEIVQNALASFLGAGSLSALRLATRIVDAFAGLLANSILTAVMPTVSHNLASSDKERMKQTISEALRLLLLVCLPAMAWLLAMKKPLIVLLFERMNFSSNDTDLVCSILALSVPYIFLSRLFGLAEIGFYAGCDTKTPLLGQLMVTVFYIVGMLVFFSRFAVYVFPIARSLAYVASSILMIHVLQRRFGRFRISELTIDGCKIIFATAGMIAVMIAGGYVVQFVPISGLSLKLVLLVVPTFIGIGGLLLFCYWLGIQDIRDLFFVFRFSRRDVVRPK